MHYARRITNHGNPELIVAIQNGSRSYIKTVDNQTIKFETENSLLDNLIDFEDYFSEIERRVKRVSLPDSRLTIEKIYVSPLCSPAPHHVLSEDAGATGVFTFEHAISKWVQEDSNRQIALLGEYGQGKSTVALKFVHDLISDARDGRSRIPLLIELRGKSPSTLQPLEFLGAWASAYRIEPRSLMKLIVAGRIILIFEGFDEMAESGDLETRLNHFRAIWRFCYPNAKLIITGRPNFFLDDHELKAALGIGSNSGAIPYCDPLYLHFFNETHIADALREMDSDTSKQIIALSRTDAKFKEVVSRPALLHMVALLWKTHFAQVKNIDSAFIINLFIKHLYERQASKASRDNAFMCLSLPEREYFQEGIAAYMVATGLKNQILADQFLDAVAKLYDEVPRDLYKKGQAHEPMAPTRPLKERLKGRPKPLDDVYTDVRTYGILVRDYSRLSAFRFPHKSFFELLFAKYIADQLVGDNKEENAAIRAATRANVAQIIDMPECLSFLGELLNRRKAERSTPRQGIQGLFDSIVLGGRFHLPALLTRIILLENLLVRSERRRSFFRVLLTRPSFLLMFMFMIPVYSVFVFRLATGSFIDFRGPFVDILGGERGIHFTFLSMLFFVAIAFLAFSSILWRKRIILWSSVIVNLGYTEKEITSLYGSAVAASILRSLSEYSLASRHFFVR